MTYSPMLTKSLSRSNTLMVTSTSNPMSESPSQLGTSIVVNFSPILLSTTGTPSQHLNSVFSTHVQPGRLSFQSAYDNEVFRLYN